jgi:hypothetical protein
MLRRLAAAGLQRRGSLELDMRHPIVGKGSF